MFSLTEIAGNPAPKGGEVFELRTDDGVSLRAAEWRPGGKARGTMFVLQGRSEYIEKYFETAGDLMARGFVVFTFDWRGQGGDQRLLDDPLKGHVDHFSDYVLDLMAAVKTARARALPEPYALLGHSMGAAIALLYLHEFNETFRCATLMTPMLEVKSPYPGWVTRIIAWAGTAFGYGSHYVPDKAQMRPPQDAVFEGNPVTSDRARFARNVDVLKANPALGVGQLTFGWLNAAFHAMARINAPAFASAMTTPMLIVSAGKDQIVIPGRDGKLAQRLRHATFVAFSDAEHEILQERDEVRAEFFAAFDAFTTQHIPG